MDGASARGEQAISIQVGRREAIGRDEPIVRPNRFEWYCKVLDKALLYIGGTWPL